MKNSIYLINPKEGSTSYYGLEFAAELGFGSIVTIADLATTTVAALVPSHWKIDLCDERISSVNMHHAAEVIGITGKSSQRDRMIELANHFRSIGKLVVFGGPYASLNPEDLAPHCDILVVGEIEEIAEKIFRDIDKGEWKPRYDGTKVDFSISPIPRWDLYPRGKALGGAIQTSRGCPFDCEFCDVIQYAGRKQRHKPVEKVIAELEVLHNQGYSYIFLADDNFTVYRRRAKELLSALAEWNRAHQDRPVIFTTQVSIDAARDPELLDLCYEAGIKTVFIGIETPNEESLRETKKRQNVGIDIVHAIETFIQHGLSVTGGIIVGFDSDGSEIFDLQKEFIEKLPVPIVTIGALVAPPTTPLYKRLHDAGRISSDERSSVRLASKGKPSGATFSTNVIPKKMTQDELSDGLRSLLSTVYAPDAFEKRIQKFISISNENLAPALKQEIPFQLSPFHLKTLKRIAKQGRHEKEMILRLLKKLPYQQLDVRRKVLNWLITYAQIRYFMADVFQNQ